MLRTKRVDLVVQHAYLWTRKHSYNAYGVIQVMLDNKATFILGHNSAHAKGYDTVMHRTSVVAAKSVAQLLFIMVECSDNEDIT